MISKKNTILIAIGLVTLLIVIIGATYAYFTAQGGGSNNTNVDVTTGTTDLLSFSFGDEIYISANETNFGQGMENLSDSTTATAILRANNATNSATATYNVYLIIEANDFEYTTDNQTPELLLNVTDPTGRKIENITGLLHYEEGFDITTRTGGFLLVPDYEISATAVEAMQDWTIEITFANLDSDQLGNAGKTLSGKLYLTQEQMSSYELTEINNVETTIGYDSVTVALDMVEGSGATAKYYYGIEKTDATMAYVDNHTSLQRLSNTLGNIGEIEFVESDSPTHTFTDLEENSSYTIYSYSVDENKIKSNVYETEVTTGTFVAPEINSVTHSVTLNSISLTVEATAGSNEIVKYMYSKDNGNSWEESTSNTHTFSNLTDTTEYKIKVKAVDSKGNASTEYYEAITTEIYVLPTVTSVDATTTYNSITLTPSGTNGTGTIVKYMYSIDDGAYQESNVFSNLNENTEYTIKVKAIDSNNRESNVYTTTVTTDQYKLPTIGSVITSATVNSVTINVTATPGDGDIVSYHYSKDDGSNYIVNTNNSYTFSGLTPNTTFYIKVYVTDSNGRTSVVYQTSQKTEPDTITLSFASSNDITNFLKYCQPQVSYDNGASWQNLTFASSAGGTTVIKANAQIKVNNRNTDPRYGCAINICTSASCSSNNYHTFFSDNIYTKNSVYNHVNNIKNYTLNGTETHYSLVYCSCLVGNTEVYVLDKNKKKKKKKIKDIKKNDKVYIVDEKGNVVIRKVKANHQSKATTIFKVILENGEIIECSSRHSFIELNLGILYVEELKVGYELLNIDGNTYKITDIIVENYPEGIEVYNLEFEENNAKIYAISASMILTFGIVLGLSEAQENHLENNEINEASDDLAAAVFLTV